MIQLTSFSELCLDPLLKKPLVDNAVLKQHILAWHYCTQTVLDEYLQRSLNLAKGMQRFMKLAKNTLCCQMV